LSVAVFTSDVHFVHQWSRIEAARTVLLFNSPSTPRNIYITRKLCNPRAGFIIINRWKIQMTSDQGPMNNMRQITCEKKNLIKIDASVTTDTNYVDKIDHTSQKTHRFPEQKPTPLSCTGELPMYTNTHCRRHAYG
jgi:hypothetical protein